jgi:hypothetical protein
LVLKGVQEDLSGAAILRGLREAGMGLRTQTFYRWLGQAKKEVAAELGIVGLESHQRAPRASISAWPTESGREGYLHIVNYTTKNRLTGFTETKTISVASENLLTRAEAEATAEEVIRDNEAEYPEFQTLGWSLTAVRQLTPWEGP